MAILLDFDELHTWLLGRTTDKLVLTFLMGFYKKHGISTTNFSDSVVWELRVSQDGLTCLLTIGPIFNEQLPQELIQWLTNLGFHVRRTSLPSMVASSSN